MPNTSREERPTDNVGTQVAPQQQRREGATTKEETDSRVSRKGEYFGGLEPYDGKLSRTVLRGEGSRKAPDLPGTYYFFAVSDSIKTAKRYKNQYEPKKFNKAYVYIGTYLLIAIVSTSLSAVMKSNFVQAFKISSAAMEPTLLLGDHVLTDRSQSARKPNRGDLIVFEYPEDPTKDFIKRVVAVGGDTVEIRNKELLVNGKAVSEPYIIHNEANVVPAKENHRDNYGPTTIPEGEYFGMGDNRDRSYDSRFWGTIPQNRIKGSVKSIYWSWDKEKFAVRWNRVGTKVQ